MIGDSLGAENVSELTQDLQAFVDQQRERADRALLRLGLGAAVLIVLAALAAWIVWHASHGPPRRVSSRPWPKPAPESTLP